MALDNNYTGLTKLKDWWGKVKANFTYLDDRISTIITTPAEGVSAQEIIDARKGEAALGDKIDAMDAAHASHEADIVTDADGAHGLKMSSINLNAALVNGWVAYTTPVIATRIGNRVFVSGGIEDGTVTAGTTIFTLPEGYRPADAVFVPATQHTATPGVKHLRVKQDGTVMVDNNYAWTTGVYFFDFNFYTREA